MKFQLRAGPSVWHPIHALGESRLNDAAERLQSASASATDVHEARKSVKRTRALLAMTRRALTKRGQRLDHRLRDVNRSLSARRDAQVLRDTLASLPDTDSKLSAGKCFEILAALDTAPENVTGRIGDSLELIAQRLQRSKSEWQELTCNDNGWSLLSPNLKRTYKRGRRRTRDLATDSPAADWHDLRKAAKAWQYQLEFLRPINVERLHAELVPMEQLTEDLGRHHDLQVLSATIRALDGQVRRKTAAAVLTSIARQSRRLEASVLPMARRIYAEPARLMLARLERYWDVWQATPAPTDSTTALTDKP